VGRRPLPNVNLSSKLSSQLDGSNIGESNSISKCRIRVVIAYLSSISASVRPAQFAGPAEKGINASRDVIYSVFPGVEGSQRSGINLSGEGEK